jgi:hypothetical protein
MSLSQLQIFSKKRDATAALRGYEFQHLKTLESWLQIRINNTEEVIYCDFEEDIFQRNLSQGSSKFRQIKLYSTNFSFSSEAIQDTIANFFMLFVKGDYMFDEITFSFETNASVAERVIKGNDADLLQIWTNNQQNLIGESLQKIKDRVKVILTNYIEKEYTQKIGNVSIKPELQKAVNLFNNLADDVYNNFIQSITWQFDGIEINAAIEKQLSNINTLIQKIPVPIRESEEVAFSLLYRKVTSSSIEDKPENRKLSNKLMDLILLEAGDEKNKWYAEIYDKWYSINIIEEFQAGQFYEIIEASQYYRKNFHQMGHKTLWMSLMELYTNNQNTKPYIKRKAIYEFLFLVLKPNPEPGDVIISFKGYEDKIRYYFKEWKHRNNLRAIQEDINLLQLVSPQVLLNYISIDSEEILTWNSTIRIFLDENLQLNNTVDDQCILLELRGDLELNTSMNNLLRSHDVSNAINYYKAILPILSQTQLYSLSDLFDFLKVILTLLIRFNKDPSIILLIETFVDELQEVASATAQRLIVAKSLVRRGVDYLSTGGIYNVLQAINCFHKAKDLWFLEQTKEGYILSLLNLSQVYYLVGMNLAGKYYSLCSIWATWQFENESIYNRISQGLALLVHGDFREGNWISALDDFELFMKSRVEFNSEGWAGNNDEFFSKTLPDIAFIIFASKKFFPDITVYLNYRTDKWGDLWNVYINPMVDEFENTLIRTQETIDAAKRHITSEPLSDLGKEKSIKFNAINIEFQIAFDNSYKLNAIGEEFVSVLQIILCEITRTKKDLLAKNNRVTIKVRESITYTKIAKELKNDEWIVSIPIFDKKNKNEVRAHYAFVTSMIKQILLSLSTTAKSEFDNFWWKILFEKEKAGDKTLSTNTYQKVYYNAINENLFNLSQKTAFNSIASNVFFDQLPKLLNY